MVSLYPLRRWTSASKLLAERIANNLVLGSVSPNSGLLFRLAREFWREQPEEFSFF